MKVRVIKPFKKDKKLLIQGEIISISPSEYEKLKGLVEPVLVGESLNRKCVVCGSDSWRRAKPKGSTLITCLRCNHSELYIEYRRPKFDEIKERKDDR